MRLQWYKYLIDYIDRTKCKQLEEAMKTVPQVVQANMNYRSQTLWIMATSNVKEQVEMACKIVGCSLRTQLK